MTFAVFGVTRADAKKSAQHALNAITNPTGARHQFKAFERAGLTCCANYCQHIIGGTSNAINYECAVDELAVVKMQKMRPKRISTLYSSPDRCEEYRELAHKDGAIRLSIRAQVKRTDATGAEMLSKKTKRPMHHWVEWTTETARKVQADVDLFRGAL